VCVFVYVILPAEPGADTTIGFNLNLLIVVIVVGGGGCCRGGSDGCRGGNISTTHARSRGGTSDGKAVDAVLGNTGFISTVYGGNVGGEVETIGSGLSISGHGKVVVDGVTLGADHHVRGSNGIGSMGGPVPGHEVYTKGSIRKGGEVIVDKKLSILTPANSIGHRGKLDPVGRGKLRAALVETNGRAGITGLITNGDIDHDIGDVVGSILSTGTDPGLEFEGTIALLEVKLAISLTLQTTNGDLATTEIFLGIGLEGNGN